jgi:mortality factor 4-like protein 1
MFHFLTIFLTTAEGGIGGGTGGTAGGSGVAGASRRKEGRGTKRGRDEDDAVKKPDMKLNVPEVLKVFLVDDWEAVTKNNQVGATLCNALSVI